MVDTDRDDGILVGLFGNLRMGIAEIYNMNLPPEDDVPGYKSGIEFS
ncbi:MAG: hypothetical protein J7K87_04060 [Candidatus Aenigmarchaeota archaeon]|nr:hypothetical protein [Candidatus Aenigmarchaeota archaeon]